MPYIITIYSRHEVYGTPNAVVAESRRTVTTLDKAREAVSRELIERTSRVTVEQGALLRTLPESGATIGPLPDGTTIEVIRA